MNRFKRRVWGVGLVLTLAGGIYGQTTVNGGRVFTGNLDASAAATTKPARTGTTLPATCGTGEQFFLTSATPGQNIYVCTATNTWTQGAGAVASVFGRTGAVTGQSGDYSFSQLSGSAGLNQLAQGGASANQVLTWNGTQWNPVTWTGGGGVASVFGRTGAVIAQSGDYTTAQVTESGNLYFTNARAQAALSGLYQTPLTFSSPLANSSGTVGCATCLTTNTGNWAGTWQSYSPSYFQPALTFSSPLG